ncbi:hypothetical protein [Streptomyces sp. NPDC058206]|uniref:hypothetical protein n=1 Tax=Streptomyces sp. NPDC058206 TaxID=3346382 RepID=UPI0036EF7FE1
MTTGPAFRLARAAIFAAVCVATTGLGHALMSEAVPGWAIAYAFAATTAGGWWLAARRERGAVAVTGSTVVAQLALHGLFAGAQAFVHAPAATGGMSGMAHMHHATGSMSMASPAGSEWSAGMALAHTLAALVCGLWLWRGEAAAFRVGRAITAFVFAPLRRARRAGTFAGLPKASIRSRVAYGDLPQPHRVLLRHAVSRRGPPGSPVCC